MNEDSWVGLDVHARSVVAGVLDAGTGERFAGNEVFTAHRDAEARPQPAHARGGPHRYQERQHRVAELAAA